MYQGKFSSNNAKQKAANDELLAQRSQAIKKNPPKALPRQLPREEPDLLVQPQKRGAARQNVPNQAPARRPVQQQPVRAPQPVQEYREEEPRRRGPSVGGVIFYTFYFLVILLFVGATFLGLNWLNGWLIQYEAAQPTVKCQEVFDKLFSNPDWGELYTMSGQQDTIYEGKDAYVAYMNEKADGKKLSFVETSAGLSNGKKYFVNLDNERIGSFTLEGQGEKVTDVPDWKLGKVELYFTRSNSYRFSKTDGHTVYVNGVALDDSFTIQTASTNAEKYLPVGTASVKTCIQSISNLLIQPTVTIKDQSGADMPVSYDESSRMYVEQTESNTLTDTERTLVASTLKAYAEYMIRASGSTAAVNKYFDVDSKTYKDIVSMAGELWMNKDYGHRFTAEEVTDYARYSNDLFSARGKVTMNVNLKDGGTKDYTIDMAVFFRRKNGNFVCYEMTNEDVTKPVGEVRLTFQNDGTVLDSYFVKTDAVEITTPVMTVPDGKTFVGWIREIVKEDGTKEYDLVFTPDQDGKVLIGAGTVLEPMVLLPYFETAKEAT